MHSSWILVALMGVVALFGSLLARARWQHRHAPIVLEERPIPRRHGGSRESG
jgi:hypothetical protein